MSALDVLALLALLAWPLMLGVVDPYRQHYPTRQRAGGGHRPKGRAGGPQGPPPAVPPSPGVRGGQR